MFVDKLQEFAQAVYEKYEQNGPKDVKDMIMTDADKIAHENATKCHICDNILLDEQKIDGLGNCYEYGTEFADEVAQLAIEDKKEKLKEFIKVRDHCHITGKYRGAAHACCNLNYQLPSFYPVILHNLSGYDAHLFIKTLGGNIT